MIKDNKKTAKVTRYPRGAKLGGYVGYILHVNNFGAYLKRFAIAFKISKPIENTTTKPEPVMTNTINAPIKNPFL